MRHGSFTTLSPALLRRGRGETRERSERGWRLRTRAQSGRDPRRFNGTGVLHRAARQVESVGGTGPARAWAWQGTGNAHREGPGAAARWSAAPGSPAASGHHRAARAAREGLLRPHARRTRRSSTSSTGKSRQRPSQRASGLPQGRSRSGRPSHVCPRSQRRSYELQWFRRGRGRQAPSHAGGRAHRPARAASQRSSAGHAPAGAAVERVARIARASRPARDEAVGARERAQRPFAALAGVVQYAGAAVPGSTCGSRSRRRARGPAGFLAVAGMPVLAGSRRRAVAGAAVGLVGWVSRHELRSPESPDAHEVTQRPPSQRRPDSHPRLQPPQWARSVQVVAARRPADGGLVAQVRPASPSRCMPGLRAHARSRTRRSGGSSGVSRHDPLQSGEARLHDRRARPAEQHLLLRRTRRRQAPQVAVVESRRRGRRPRQSVRPAEHDVRHRPRGSSGWRASTPRTRAAAALVLAMAAQALSHGPPSRAVPPC